MFDSPNGNQLISIYMSSLALVKSNVNDAKIRLGLKRNEKISEKRSTTSRVCLSTVELFGSYAHTIASFFPFHRSGFGVSFWHFLLYFFWCYCCCWCRRVSFEPRNWIIEWEREHNSDARQNETSAVCVSMLHPTKQWTWRRRVCASTRVSLSIADSRSSVDAETMKPTVATPHVERTLIATEDRCRLFEPWRSSVFRWLCLCATETEWNLEKRNSLNVRPCAHTFKCAFP